MTQAHLFALECPYFSAHDIDSYNHNFDFSKISEGFLTHIKKYEAAKWLRNNNLKWQKFLDSSKYWDDEVLRGRFQLIKWGEQEFPENLRRISYPPAVLFIRGDKNILREKSVAFVGARSPTQLGRLWLEEIIPEVIKASLITVSGGARGIDSEAHSLTLAAGGKTIAFLPGGVDRPYPVSNTQLFLAIEANGGALASEFPPGTAVRAESFFRRNRLIAGISNVVVIVEAGQKSGTLLTAKSAMRENKEILVLPGPPMVASYAGSLDLLAEGASMVRNASDVIASANKKMF
jgi:DNA processing protein